MTHEPKPRSECLDRTAMPQQKTERIQRLELYSSAIALVGLASSILSGNKDGLFATMSIPQQELLLVFASAMVLHAVYRRIQSRADEEKESNERGREES